MNECTCETYRDHLLRPCYTTTARRTKWQRDHEKPPQVVREAEQAVASPENEPPTVQDWSVYKWFKSMGY